MRFGGTGLAPVSDLLGLRCLVAPAWEWGGFVLSVCGHSSVLVVRKLWGADRVFTERDLDIDMLREVAWGYL